MPVQDLPESFNILGPGVAVVDVIGVLPDVAGEKGFVPAGQGGGGIRGNFDHQAIVGGVQGKPCPTGTELFDRGIGELLLEPGAGTKGFIDGLG